MKSPDDATLLERYHAHPGKTVAMLEPFRDEQGRTSYQILAAELSDLPPDPRVLDVACGDGHLLALLAARGIRRLVGVDRSPEELTAARARLGPRADFFCHDASALPLPDRSVDAVVCHMALMLMDSLDQTLAEIARVLVPGRWLVAVVNRPHPDPVFAVYSQELRRVTAEAGLDRLRLGPPDIFSIAGLRTRLRRPYFDEERVAIQDFVVQFRASPQELWPLLESTYDVFRLPAIAKAAMQRTVISMWDAMCEGCGQLTAAMGLRLIKCPTLATGWSP